MNIFAKIVQRPGVRRHAIWPLAVGWGLFVASLFAPAAELTNMGSAEQFSGWECFCWSFCFPINPYFIPTWISNVAMLSSPYFAAWALMGTSTRSIMYGMIVAFLIAVSSIVLVERVLAGYYLWSVSFLFAGVSFYNFNRSPVDSDGAPHHHRRGATVAR